MPTNRTRTSKRRSARAGELSERQIFKLETGHDFSFYDGPGFEDDDQLADGWTQYKKGGRLRDFIAKHPGRRPWRWWCHDAPEPRRIVRPELAYVCLNPEDWRQWFGKASRYLCQPPDDLYESELDYLVRLGLLTESERSI